LALSRCCLAAPAAQRAQRRRHLARARVVQEEAVERRAPVVQHAHQASGRQVLRHRRFDHVRQPGAGQRRLDQQVVVVEHQRPACRDIEHARVALEFPFVQRAAAAGAVADAGVCVQVFGRDERRWVAGEIGGRTDHDRAQPVSHAHRDHVLVQAFAKADAATAASTSPSTTLASKASSHRSANWTKQTSMPWWPPT